MCRLADKSAPFYERCCKMLKFIIVLHLKIRYPPQDSRMALGWSYGPMASWHPMGVHWGSSEAIGRRALCMSAWYCNKTEKSLGRYLEDVKY